MTNKTERMIAEGKESAIAEPGTAGAANAADAAAEAARVAEQAEAAEAEIIKRKKTGRGSTRRILRARDDLDNALVAFKKEMDAQAYEADDAGEKTGPLPMLRGVEDFRSWMIAEVSKILA